LRFIYGVSLHLGAKGAKSGGAPTLRLTPSAPALDRALGFSLFPQVAVPRILHIILLPLLPSARSRPAIFSI
jgi:hypothetical protein